MTINSGDFYRQKVATIGGTFQKGDWNTEVNEETKQEMFKEAIALEPTLKVKLCFSASTQLIIKMTKWIEPLIYGCEGDSLNQRQ